MKGLSGLKHLRKIDLGANRIRVMEVDELAGLTQLEELWLGKNKIESIQGLDTLLKLRRLDVQSNRLTAVENLQAVAPRLEELYLAHNAIDDAGASHETGLACEFPELSVLDLIHSFPSDCAVRSTHLESTICRLIRTLVSHQDPNWIQTVNE